MQPSFILLLVSVRFLLWYVRKRPFGSRLIVINNTFIMDTFDANDVGIRRWSCHLEGQAVGPLEGIAVSDEESSWFFVFQNSYGYGREDTLE